MIKKTISYHDYEGNERTDDFYFHLTQVELSKINSISVLLPGIQAVPAGFRLIRVQENPCHHIAKHEHCQPETQ